MSWAPRGRGARNSSSSGVPQYLLLRAGAGGTAEAMSMRRGSGKEWEIFRSGSHVKRRRESGKYFGAGAISIIRHDVL